MPQARQMIANMNIIQILLAIAALISIAYVISLLRAIVRLATNIPYMGHLIALFSLNSSYELGCSSVWFAITARAVGATSIFILLAWLWKGAFPFAPFAFWHLRGSFWEIISTAWPIFIGGGLAFLLPGSLMGYLMSRQERRLEGQIGLQIGTAGAGMWQSIWNGLGEEIMFRWIVFYDAIALLAGLNFMLGGFRGQEQGMLEWIYTTLLGPLVNAVTLGMLQNILFHQGWAVGAAIILISFGRFARRFFPITGNLSWLFFWPIGLFLFQIMFTYGIIASMLVHMLYEAVQVLLTLATLKWLREHPEPLANEMVQEE